MESLRDDINLILTLESTGELVDKIMHPFKLHLRNLSLSSTLTGDSLPLINDTSDCGSDGDLESNADAFEDVHDERHLLFQNVFTTMTDLVSAYDLKTCLISIREHHCGGEQIFLLHSGVFHTMWRAQMFLPSDRFSRLLVMRSIPTVVADVSKDDRLANSLRPSQAQFFVQAPLGLTNEGQYLGVIYLIGRQGLTKTSLHDFDLLTQKADELASMLMGDFEE